MNKESMPQVPSGLVKDLATRWELNSYDKSFEDSQGTNDKEVRPRKNVPQLNNKFFQDVLGRIYSELEVTGFALQQGREEGPNQTSNIANIKVRTADHSNLYLIFKIINSSSPKAKALNFKELFKKEAHMYSTVIPSLIGLRPQDPLTMFPMSLHTSSDLLVLDDLTCHGFRTGSHREGLDSAHCKLVLAELGRFHAAAYVLKNSDALNEASRELQYTKERSSIYREHFQQLAKDAVDIIRRAPETSRYARQMEDVLNDAYNQILTHLQPKEPFVTLTHGQLWTGNIMFSYSEGKPASVKFLDFQTCRYGSPALDINYFLYTSTTSETRDKYMDELMRTYHRSLTRGLRLMGVGSDVSLTDLRREVNSKSLYGVLMAHLVLQDAFEDCRDVYAKRVKEMVVELGELGVI